MKAKKIFLLIVIATYIFSGSAFAEPKGKEKSYAVPGEFDYYVFSLSWQPTFCETKPDKKECATQTAERYDSKNLVLHGLWPNKNDDKHHNYGYCGVKSGVRKLDKASTWCRMPAPTLSDDTKKNLAVYMPGYASCLERHEWYKHGACSGLKAEDYFVTAYTLVTKIADTNFGRYISANVGNTVDSDDLLSELVKDFGEDSRDFITIYCESIKGSGMLSEVRMYLINPLPSDGGLKEMFVRPESPEQGNCPQKILIDRVHGTN
ncbi:MAG: hypothetical protein ACHQ0Y_15240 [Thermodesulfovibrionales bacterium]